MARNPGKRSSGTGIGTPRRLPGMAFWANELAERAATANRDHLADLGACRVEPIALSYWRQWPDWRLEPRAMPNAWLMVPVHGAARVQVGAATATVAPGQLLIVPEGVRHAAAYAPGARELDQLSIHLLVRDRAGADFLARCTAPVAAIPDWRWRWSRLLAATAAFNAERASGRVLAEAVLRELLAALVADGLPLRAPAVLDARLARCLEALHADPAAQPGVPALAALAGLSETRLRRLFRQHTGLPPKAYADRVRLERAAALLAGTTLTVKDIAHDLGYASDHHFHTCFRRRYQATPSAWRQRREP